MNTLWYKFPFLLFQDYFTIGRQTPPLDAQQDWMLLSSSEENSVTTLKFYRKRNTTDQQDDVAIPVKYFISAHLCCQRVTIEINNRAWMRFNWQLRIGRVKSGQRSEVCAMRGIAITIFKWS